MHTIKIEGYDDGDFMLYITRIGLSRKVRKKDNIPDEIIAELMIHELKKEVGYIRNAEFYDYTPPEICGYSLDEALDILQNHRAEDEANG